MQIIRTATAFCLCPTGSHNVGTQGPLGSSLCRQRVILLRPTSETETANAALGRGYSPKLGLRHLKWGEWTGWAARRCVGFGAAAPRLLEPPPLAPADGSPWCQIFWCLLVSVSCSVMSDSLRPIARQASLSMDFPGKNTGVGCHSLFQGIFLTQGLNPGLLHCRWILYCLGHLDCNAGIVDFYEPSNFFIN